VTRARRTHEACRRTGLLLSALLFFGTVLSGPASANANQANARFDCSANAVIRCGAPSASAVIRAFGESASIRSIYSFFGISRPDVDSLATTTVAGVVTATGDVYVNGRLAASGALTAVRRGATGGKLEAAETTSFYLLKVAASGQASSSPAYVVMRNGKFVFTIMYSCGNPVG